MPSNSGSPEPPRECPPGVHSMFDPCPGDCGKPLSMGGAEFNPEPQTEDHRRQWRQHMIGRTPVVPMPVLSMVELDRIADGEPYCFRCGKPASSFEAYGRHGSIGDDLQVISAADYVRQEEGTYNPETNRFACDGCYIAIGMPAAPGGWRAP